MKCKNCGAELMDDIIFCPECGEKREISGQENTKKYCPQCGTENSDEAGYCVSCGFSLDENVSADQGSSVNTKKKSAWKKGLTIGAAVVVIAALGVGAYTAIGAMGIFEKNDKLELLYIQDKELKLLSGNKPLTIEEDPYANDYSLSSSETFLPIKFSDDGKYLFYPRDYSSSGYDLYRKKAKSTKDDAAKVDSDVRSYSLINNNKIAYIKTSDDKLYISDMKDKEKIDSDVSWFQVSDDKKYIFWFTYDHYMYVQDINLKKDKIKLDSDVSGIYYISDDLKTVIYESDENLYIIKNFGDEEKIASDIENANAYVKDDKLTLYYTKIADSGVELNIGALINDDMEAADALIVEPKIKDYQKTVTKDSFWGPMESTVPDYDAYNAEYQKYLKKAARDKIRKNFDQTLGVSCQELYYYSVNTGESELVLSDPTEGLRYSNGIAVVQYYDLDSIEKLNLSGLTDLKNSELTEKIESSLCNGMKMCVIDGQKELALDIDAGEYGDLVNARACADNEMLYLICQGENSDDKTLLSTDLEKDNGMMKEISDEVYRIELANAEGVYYTASVGDNSEGELYCNDKLVSDEVSMTRSVYSAGKNGVLYYTDLSDNEGTLMLYRDGKNQKISDEVAGYLSLDDDRIALLVDYNFNKYKGDLKLYSNGKIKDIDTDVTSIVIY